jgi:hypothetical protein
MPESLRIFISSPADVNPERRRCALVIEKLAKEYARFFEIEPFLWEAEPQMASEGHFQDPIVPPSETDIVVLILWSRLGTSLPPQTLKRRYCGIDGRVPVTGTEWEFENALQARQEKGAPDLLAYRKTTAPVVSLKDRAAKTEAEAQWDKLEVFWSRHFVNRGQFIAAFSTFETLETFEDKLENDLRKLIVRRINASEDKANRSAPLVWPTGSPFRGLDSYRFEHHRIFFGRSAATKTVVERLVENAEAGRPFLLILGASGAGKSWRLYIALLGGATRRILDMPRSHQNRHGSKVSSGERIPNEEPWDYRARNCLVHVDWRCALARHCR